MKTKTALLAMVFLVLVAPPVRAQSNEPPIPASPPDNKYVLDELDWLTNDQETQINGIIQRLDNDGLAEIAVVTLDNCGTDKLTFRKSLFNAWGMGHTNDNDGLLLLVCWYGGDESRRSVEQEYGPGLNGLLTGERTDQIVQDNFAPAFRQERPGDGLVTMVRTYESIFRGTNSNQSNFFADYYYFVILMIIWLGIVVAVIIIRQIRGTSNISKGNKRKRKSRHPDRELWWYGDGGSSSSGSDGGGGFDGGSSDGGGGSSSDF